ncbi:hypothetical protein BJA01nite_77940 [Bradyrhizobium japonicum]|nr:hypothetical protein BJA01nite_77940 [Bradyrhizobium japonicum]
MAASEAGAADGIRQGGCYLSIIGRSTFGRAALGSSASAAASAKNAAKAANIKALASIAATTF